MNYCCVCGHVVREYLDPSTWGPNYYRCTIHPAHCFVEAVGDAQGGSMNTIQRVRADGVEALEREGKL